MKYKTLKKRKMYQLVKRFADFEIENYSIYSYCKGLESLKVELNDWSSRYYILYADIRYDFVSLLLYDWDESKDKYICIDARKYDMEREVV